MGANWAPFFMRSILVLLFVIYASLSHSQEAFWGRIVDSQSQRALPNVEVISVITGRSDITGQNGRFQLQRPTATNDTIAVSRIGYRTDTIMIPADMQNVPTIGLIPAEVGLNTVEVSGYSGQRPYKRAPYATQKVDKIELEGFDRSSPSLALNSIPGVQMDERGYGGSRRLSIRGSLLREPYGVRGIKMYWNGLLITRPDGTTPLELFDPAEVANAQVIKGPHGAHFGPGNGGVLWLQSPKPFRGDRSIESGVRVGAFGYARQENDLRYSNERFGMRVFSSFQRNHGYRSQESNHKSHWVGQLRFLASEDRYFTLHLLYYDGMWELPGSITGESAGEDPRQALSESIDLEARVERRWIAAGITQTYHFSENWTNETALYLSSTSKLNPYGTSSAFQGIKDEGGRDFTLRSVFSNDARWGDIPVKVHLGIEGLLGDNAITEFNNDSGFRGEMKYDADIRSFRGNAFARMDAELSGKLDLTAGIGWNLSGYRYEDLDTLGRDLSGDRNFLDNWLPELGLNYSLNDRFGLFANLSRGRAMPTIWELQLPEGGLDEDLSPETAYNAEAGIRFVDGKQLQVQANGYFMRLENMIFPVENDSGQVFYGNIGTGNYRGIETSIQWRPFEKLRINLAGSAQWLRFNTSDVSSEPVPGTPIWKGNSTIAWQPLKGLSFVVNSQVQGPTPLDISNDLRADPWHVLNLGLNYEHEIGDRWIVSGNVGCRNVTDALYTRFYQLNAFGGRYYNPMPGRYPYGGLTVRYDFSTQNR